PVSAGGALLSPGPKIVRPPKPGTTRFITVQIDPAEQARALASLPAFVPLTPPPAASAGAGAGAGSAVPAGPGPHYGWFWKQVSPQLNAPPGRFAEALSALGQGPNGNAVAAPSAGQMSRLAQLWGSEIQLATAGTPISPAFVLAVMAVESGGNPKALSPAGARGLMQLMPATAARFDVRDSYDSDQN
ncbi:lytic transglycosylase domain-containing protein, partial [Thioclava sp. BHET1]